MVVGVGSIYSSVTLNKGRNKTQVLAQPSITKHTKKHVFNLMHDTSTMKYICRKISNDMADLIEPSGTLYVPSEEQQISKCRYGARPFS